MTKYVVGKLTKRNRFKDFFSINKIIVEPNLRSKKEALNRVRELKESGKYENVEYTSEQRFKKLRKLHPNYYQM